jgi:hypothetical protein
MTLFNLNKSLIYTLLLAFMAAAALSACSSSEEETECKDDPDCVDQVF